MKKLISILLVLLTATNAFATSGKKIFDKANNAYKNQNYEIAISNYEKLIKSGTHSADIYFNLGNAYFKTNQIGKAILNYERAKNLKPEEEDIQHNLAFAKSFLRDKIIVQNPGIIQKFKSQFLGALSALNWSITGIVMIWVALLLMALYLFASNFRRLFFFSGSFLFIASLLFFFMGRQQAAVEIKCGYGIVTLAKAFVKSAPSNDAADIFMLHEGTEVKILDRVDGFSKIRIADGQVGWADMDAIAAI
jgi:tetratricopeptide (TPR) repeat protein